MVVPFVHRWMLIDGFEGIGGHGPRRTRDPRVACARGSRHPAMTSTNPAGEPRVIAAQAPVIVTATFVSCAFIGFSFLLGSDSSQRAWRIAVCGSKEVSRGRQIRSMATS